MRVPSSRRGSRSSAGGYDGLGRLVSVERTTDPGFVLRQVQTVKYNDISLPNAVTTRQKLDHTAETWVTSDAAYDGLGRPLTERLQTGPATWAASSYDYDGAGNLIRFVTPSPTGVGNECTAISMIPLAGSRGPMRRGWPTGVSRTTV